MIKNAASLKSSPKKKKFLANKATICLDETEEENIKSLTRDDGKKKDVKDISDRLYNTITESAHVRKEVKAKEIAMKAKRMKDEKTKDMKSARGTQKLATMSSNTLTLNKIIKENRMPSVNLSAMPFNGNEST